MAGARVRELAESLRFGATLPHEPTGEEDYVVHFIESFDGVADVGVLATLVDIPALILGEPDVVLARDVTQPILESSLSYARTDLAVIDWNSALVVDPAGRRAGRRRLSRHGASLRQAGMAKQIFTGRTTLNGVTLHSGARAAICDGQ